MLFDLRGRGRRRTVQVIYLGLALLFLVGFVGFGVGGVGGGGGGVIEGLFGSNKGSGEINYSGQLKKARLAVAQQPNSASAEAKLIEAMLLQAGTGSNYNKLEESYTSKAKPLLSEAQQAWARYLTLNANNPSADLANLMYFKVFSGPGSLENKQDALQALQIVVAARPPTVGLFEQLAILSYQTHDTREGDLAAKKAIALAPAAEKSVLENQLAQVKKNPEGKQEGQTVTQTVTGTTPQTTAPKEFNPNAASAPTSSTAGKSPAKK